MVVKINEWLIIWDDGLEDVIESDGRPDTDSIEEGVDADSDRWGHRIVKSKKVLKKP
jgi:hypothetical protein